MKIEVKKLNPDAKLPETAHSGDAGFDLCAAEAVEINSGERVLIGTGFGIKIPKNHAGLIWDRSGLAVKEGITSIAGVIDSGYRGEVKVALINLGKNTYNIKKGERIAQMIIQRFEESEFVEIHDWSDKETPRGEGSFGSTGKH